MLLGLDEGWTGVIRLLSGGYWMEYQTPSTGKITNYIALYKLVRMSECSKCWDVNILTLKLCGDQVLDMDVQIFT